jgi:hypothetical protein
LAGFIRGPDYAGNWKPDGSRNGDKDGNNRKTYYAPEWEQREKDSINQAVWDVAVAYANAYNEEMLRRYWEECGYDLELYTRPVKITPYHAFLEVHGGRVYFERRAENALQYFSQGADELVESKAWAYTVSSRNIVIFSNVTADNVVAHPRWIVHELGHAFENAMLGTLGRRAGREGLPAELWYRTVENEQNGGFAGGFEKWQYSRDEGPNGRGEIFADMFVGWVYNQWEVDDSGLTATAVKRADYMNSRMPGWVTDVILNR